MIPFNKPCFTGKEIEYILKAIKIGNLAGDGFFTKKTQKQIDTLVGCKNSLLTHSCTAALEICTLLTDLEPGDEVIMPSYTFVSTANAFCLRKAVPVFVDIRKDTLNINEDLIEKYITDKTKAIVVVHYAGVSSEMESILKIASKHNLLVIEDAAQGLCAKYKGIPLGQIGDLGCLSFHETKNIHCGEGGALVINNQNLFERAEIIREKGTNRSQFFRGRIDKYKWIDLGSSFIPSELVAAFLLAQLQQANEITRERVSSWNKYHNLFEELEKENKVRRPVIPDYAEHNGHIYYLLLNKAYDRGIILQKLEKSGIKAVFHYQPLHTSPAGLKYGITPSPLPVTNDISERLIRLPMWIGFDSHQYVFDSVKKVLS